MSKKKERDIQTFICTSMFLADQLVLSPEEIISATLVMQKRQCVPLKLNVKELNVLISNFLDRDDIAELIK
jgi:hypothetical protein